MDNALADVFGQKWRNYELRWCHLCDTASIICPKCSLASCSGGGCDSCKYDFLIFSNTKKNVQDYLTESEKVAYYKGLRLQRLIIKSLVDGEPEINWKKMKENGELSQHEEELFTDLIQ